MCGETRARSSEHLTITGVFRCALQKAGWDGMVASSKQAEDQLASLRADLSAQQGLNRKLMAQVKEKDARIKALEAELAAFAGKSGPCWGSTRNLENNNHESLLYQMPRLP
jgi:septal ring factor EnvC (AmiA/AmiB activator)